MRITLLIAALFAFPLFLQAQLGVQLSSNFYNERPISVPDVGDVEIDIFDFGAELAINYWLRLPTKRVEFLPTVYYARGFPNSVLNANSSLSELGTQMKVNIYPFDFGGDCDCPTFGKQGPQLQKGFFVQLTGGYAVYRGNYNFDTTTETVEGNGFTFGGGVGLDIGISNLLTITPIASVRVGTQPYRDLVLSDVTGQTRVIDGPRLTTFQLGILTSFRFDHKRY